MKRETINVENKHSKNCESTADVTEEDGGVTPLTMQAGGLGGSKDSTADEEVRVAGVEQLTLLWTQAGGLIALRYSTAGKEEAVEKTEPIARTGTEQAETEASTAM